MRRTSQKSPPQNSPEQTCGQRDSRVRIFRSAAVSEGLTEQEADSFTLAELVKGQSPENRPTWIVLENVKNLLSIHGGWDFAAVLDTLASLGYHIEYGLLNTKDFGPLKTESGSTLSLADILEPEVDQKYFLSQRAVEKLFVQLIGGMQGQRVYDPSGISVTMAAQSGGWGGKTGLYFVDLCNGNPKLTSHARCIKTKYNSGITNRGGDNSGVFYGCRAVVTPEREEKAEWAADQGVRRTGLHAYNTGPPRRFPSGL